MAQKKKKNHPNRIVCGNIPDTILIINSHAVSLAVHFSFFTFFHFVRRICNQNRICIPAMHNSDASNSFCCAVVHNARLISIHFKFSTLFSVCMTMNRWKYQTKEIIFHIFTIENNSMEIFRNDWKQHRKKINTHKHYTYILGYSIRNIDLAIYESPYRFVYVIFFFSTKYHSHAIII